MTQEEQKQFQALLRQLPQQEQEQTMQMITSWTKEGIKLGRQEGIEEGLQLGLQKGRQETYLALTLRQIRKCCGELDAATENHIHALSTEQLDRLFEATFDFTSRADLDAWLQQEPIASAKDPVAPAPSHTSASQ